MKNHTQDDWNRLIRRGLELHLEFEGQLEEIIKGAVRGEVSHSKIYTLPKGTRHNTQHLLQRLIGYFIESHDVQMEVRLQEEWNAYRFQKRENGTLTASHQVKLHWEKRKLGIPEDTPLNVCSHCYEVIRCHTDNADLNLWQKSVTQVAQAWRLDTLQLFPLCTTCQTRIGSGELDITKVVHKAEATRQKIRGTFISI